MPNPNMAIVTAPSVLLTTYAAPLYTCPNNEDNSVSVRLTNYSGAAATATLWLVPNGGARGDAHLRLKDFSIAAKDSKDVEVALTMRSGDSLFIAASAATSITASITGTRFLL